jgi:hypothetical protein
MCNGRAPEHHGIDGEASRRKQGEAVVSRPDRWVPGQYSGKLLLLLHVNTDMFDVLPKVSVLNVAQRTEMIVLCKRTVCVV